MSSQSSPTSVSETTLSNDPLQPSGVKHQPNTLINSHQSTTSSSVVNLPPPPLQKGKFLWGSRDGDSFYQDICSAYELVIHWKSSLFLPPFGAVGKCFVQELAHLFQAYADSSSLECVAMNGVAVLQQLLLQKPSRIMKAKYCTKHLQRHRDLWHFGNIDDLLNECKSV